MRADIETYRAVEAAAEKFVRSVAEGNSARPGSRSSTRRCCSVIWTIDSSTAASSKFYHNVDTVAAGPDFKARIDVLMSRRRWP